MAPDCHPKEASFWSALFQGPVMTAQGTGRGKSYDIPAQACQHPLNFIPASLVPIRCCPPSTPKSLKWTGKGSWVLPKDGLARQPWNGSDFELTPLRGGARGDWSKCYPETHLWVISLPIDGSMSEERQHPEDCSLCRVLQPYWKAPCGSRMLHGYAFNSNLTPKPGSEWRDLQHDCCHS